MSLSLRLKPCLLALACSGLLSAWPLAAAENAPARGGAKSTQAKPPQLASPQLLAQMLLSEIALARGLLDDASLGYQDLARRSDDPRIQQRARELELARIMINAPRQPAEAEAALQELLTRHANERERLLLQLPGIYSRSPDKAQVLQSILRLTQPYADIAEAHYSAGIALRDAGDATGAHARARQAQRLKPDWEPAVLLSMETAAPAQEREVRELVAAFAQRNPQALDSRVALIRWMLQDKQPDAARQAYRQLLVEHPDKPELAFTLAAVAVETGDFADAENIVAKLLEQGWGDADRLNLILGQVQAGLGKGEAALQHFDSVQPGPYFLRAQESKARLLVANKHLSEARRSLREAAVRAPAERVELLVHEASLLRQQGDQGNALKVLDEALALQPEHIEALYDSALLAEQLGRSEVLEQRMRRVIALKPDHAHALNALGYSFADRNTRLDEAEQLLTRALGLAPSDPAILDSMGWLRFRQTRLDEAERLLRQAFALFPDPEIASHLIEVIWASGRQNEARRQWQQSLSTHPGNPLLLKTGQRLGL